MGWPLTSGLGMLRGSVGSGVTNSILGKLGLTECGIPKKIVETLVGTGVDTGLDALVSALFGREFDFWRA